MKPKYIIIALFSVVALVQLYVPAQMIFEQEDVLKEGTLLHFRTQPIDPYDPLRGKYVTLRYRDTKITTTVLGKEVMKSMLLFIQTLWGFLFLKKSIGPNLKMRST